MAIVRIHATKPRHVEEAAAHGVIFDRRALAVEPRREDDAVASRRRLLGEAVEESVSLRGRRARPQLVFGIQQVVPQKGQAHPGALLLVGDVVSARDRRRQ